MLDGPFLEIEGGRRAEAGVEEPGLELAAAEVAPVVFELGQGRGRRGEDVREGGGDGVAGEFGGDEGVVFLETGNEAVVRALLLGDVAEHDFALFAGDVEGGFGFADGFDLFLEGVALGLEAGEGQGAEGEGGGGGGVDLFPVVDEALEDAEVFGLGDGAEVGHGAGEGVAAADVEADGELVLGEAEPEAVLVVAVAAKDAIAFGTEDGQGGFVEFEDFVGFVLVGLAIGLKVGEEVAAGRGGVQGDDDGAAGQGVGQGPVAEMGVEHGEPVIFREAWHRMLRLSFRVRPRRFFRACYFWERAKN